MIFCEGLTCQVHLKGKLARRRRRLGGLMYNSGKVAQPAHRIKDERLRRAFGILDTARRLCFGMVKGLLPTPAEQG